MNERSSSSAGPVGGGPALSGNPEKADRGWRRRLRLTKHHRRGRCLGGARHPRFVRRGYAAMNPFAQGYFLHPWCGHC